MNAEGKAGDSRHGNIATTEQRYRPGGVDWESNPERQTVVNNNESCDGYHASFCDNMHAIEDARIPYKELGPNSNSVVYTLLKKAGIKPPIVKRRAVGWGTQLVPLDERSRYAEKAPSSILGGSADDPNWVQRNAFENGSGGS